MERSQAGVRDRSARRFLERRLGRVGSPPAAEAEALAALLARPDAEPYPLLEAALALALLGDSRAIPVLRRVFEEGGFATTSSLHELGEAALGLALLGDCQCEPQIRSAPLINQNRLAIPLALALLGDRRR